MRKIATINLRIGLVNFSLSVNSFVDYSGISFKQLSPCHNVPIKLKRVCSECGKEIPYSELKYGYQLSKNNIIPIEKEMMDSISNRETKILMTYDNNSQLSKIEEVIQQKVYLLTPNENLSKPYFLLRELLIRKEKSLLVEYSLRGKLHLGIIKPFTLVDKYGKTHIFLLLKQIVYSDRIKPISSLPTEEVSEEELKLAIELFELLESKMSKTDYRELKDERKELLEKILKGEIKIEKPERVKEKEIVEQLKKSTELLKLKKKKKVKV